MTEQTTTGRATAEAPVRERRPAAVLGGLAVGALACWLWIVVALVSGILLDYTDTASDPVAIAVVALAFAPLLVGAVLLARSSTRSRGAGFVLGLGLGLVIGTGIFAALYLPTL